MAIELLHGSGIDYLLDPHKRLYWGYLLSAVAIALLYLAITRKPLTAVLNREIWWHPSARLDYAYFPLASLIKVSLLLPWSLSARDTTLWTMEALDSLLGYQEKVVFDRAWILAGYTLTLFLVSDLSRYWLHRLMHSVPFLWTFHKVHHSAEMLTPLTFYRVHPLENMLFGLRYALAAGLVTGVFIHFFGANLALLEIAGVNLFVFVFHLAGDNLRHSTIHLGYFDSLEKWFISPAQHQYHHTPGGTRTNYGGVLAVWDRLFGTLHLSRPQDTYSYGLDENSPVFRNIGQLLFPFLIANQPTNSHKKP